MNEVRSTGRIREGITQVRLGQVRFGQVVITMTAKMFMYPAWDIAALFLFKFTVDFISCKYFYFYFNEKFQQICLTKNL